MLTELMWLYASKRQYEMQRENGLAGLIGILVTFLIVWQWNNWFYPILDMLGFVSLADRIGMITGSPILTTINVLGLIMVLIFIFLAMVAIPTFLILSLMNLFGSNYDSNRPTPMQYAVSLILLPIFLLLYPVVKLMKALKIIKPTATEIYHVQNKDIVTKSSFIEESYLAVFTSQERKEDPTASRTVISQQEAISNLNRAIASLENMTDFIFAYLESNKTWYLLTPNPIPPFASKILVNSSPQRTPYNYGELYDNFKNNNDNLSNFYVPASKLTINWDKSTNYIDISISNEGSGYIFNCSDAKTFEKLRGKSIENLFKQAANKVSLRNLNLKAHVLSYTIPIAYPEEMKRFKTSTTPSYYRELKKVPYVDAFAPLYRADVFQEVKTAAARNNQWAIDYLTNVQNS